MMAALAGGAEGSKCGRKTLRVSSIIILLCKGKLMANRPFIVGFAHEVVDSLMQYRKVAVVPQVSTRTVSVRCCK